MDKTEVVKTLKLARQFFKDITAEEVDDAEELLCDAVEIGDQAILALNAAILELTKEGPGDEQYAEVS